MNNFKTKKEFKEAYSNFRLRIKKGLKCYESFKTTADSNKLLYNIWRWNLLKAAPCKFYRY